MSAGQDGAAAPAQQKQPRGWFRAGGWYVVVTVATAGLCAWVPFAHAARRLGESRLKRRAYNYGGLAVVLTVLVSLTPTNAAGDPIGPLGQVLSTVSGLGALAVIVMGVVQQWPLRRRVFTPGAVAHHDASAVEEAPGRDPAVAQVRAARNRRDQAREIVDNDVLMARELSIGRPDLDRSYDDGGLVDLNSAPASAIAEVCRLDHADADKIVTSRQQYPAGLTSLDEVLVLADLPVGTWDQVRDRAVLIPTTS